jgi:hypothetical protein
VNLICAAIIGGDTRYIATWDIDTGERVYRGEIISLDSFNASHSTRHGGYFRPSFGAIDLLPTACTDHWPPPATITLPLHLWAPGDTRELINATGLLRAIDPTRISYELFEPDEYEATTSAGTSSNLITYFAWACHADRLNLTLDSSLATDYAMSMAAPATATKIIDLLDQLAADTNHGFYIEDGTLHLVDLVNNTASRTLTEFDVIAASYAAPEPYSSFVSGDYSIEGAYPQGGEYSRSVIFHSSQAAIEAQLARTKSLLNKSWCTLTMPITENPIAYGEHLTLVDEQKYYTTTVTMRAREFTYDLAADRERVTIAGEGELT